MLWGEKPYYSMDYYLKQQFGSKTYKVALDAGFTCPNRDGRLSTGGCIFCDNRTFNPKYCHPGLTVTQQIAAGKSFYAGKYPHMKYLVYFQAFSNTPAKGASSILLFSYFQRSFSQKLFHTVSISFRSVDWLAAVI